MTQQIKQYDQVQLKDGHKAYIVEILEENVAYMADVERDGDTYTDFVRFADIESVVTK